MIAFHQGAAGTLRVAKDDKCFDIDNAFCQVAYQIVTECKNVENDKTSYNLHLDKDSAIVSNSVKMHKLLAAVSPKCDHSLPAILIDMLTSMITSRTTDLQVALGVLRNSKLIVNKMHDYHVTCSYDELLKSTAAAAARDSKSQGITSAMNGLVQVVADNFDTDILSQNRKMSTHSLAMIIMQPSEGVNEKTEAIQWLSKSDDIPN